MINHIRHEIPKLKRVTYEDKRLYESTEGKKYPSVTTVTGLLGIDSIMEWRAKVGAEEANRISARASKRGTAIHALCEDYLNNKPVEPMPHDYSMWNQLVLHLNHIDNVHCLETPLYSDSLEVAGTVDCIAEYKGRLSVIDFKTSGKVKHRDDIYGYFMQCSAYCHMFMELTGVPVSQIVILMGCDDSPKALTFTEKYVDWIPHFKRLRNQYRDMKGI